MLASTKINYVGILSLTLLLVTIFALLVVKDNFRLKSELFFEKSIPKNDCETSDESPIMFGINAIGAPFDVVPNTVHYVLFTVHEIQFSHFVSLLSVLKNQRP